METWLTMVVTIVCAIFSSTGIWALIQRRAEKKDAKTQMILGLGHDRIIHLCKFYIEQGWISADDYENLHEYLYRPYEAMGGNGTAKRLMDEVTKLPMKNRSDTVPRKENFEEIVHV
ncbi:MAG: hypothetical protein J6U54_11185 [Clostridiales bacterium]|nr:hypothetical protein [Clostridiales bacterium]